MKLYDLDVILLLTTLFLDLVSKRREPRYCEARVAARPGHPGHRPGLQDLSRGGRIFFKNSVKCIFLPRVRPVMEDSLLTSSPSILGSARVSKSIGGVYVLINHFLDRPENTRNVPRNWNIWIGRLNNEGRFFPRNWNIWIGRLKAGYFTFVSLYLRPEHVTHVVNPSYMLDVMSNCYSVFTPFKTSVQYKSPKKRTWPSLFLSNAVK